MTGQRPETLDQLITLWKRRADDRQATARVMGLTTIEGRIMQADAAAVAQCTAELVRVLSDEGWNPRT